VFGPDTSASVLAVSVSAVPERRLIRSSWPKSELLALMAIPRRQIANILDIGPDKAQRLASDKEAREKRRNVLNAVIARVKA
jgi:hypothetical protein